MKIAICDPSLVDHKGHHYEYQNAATIAITDNFRNAEIYWFVNKKHVLGLPDSPTIKIIGVFEADFYTPESISYERWLSNTNMMLRQCVDHGIDTVFYHTATGHDYKCIEELSPRYLNIDFNLCTPYSPRYMPSPTQGEELIKIQAKLQNRVNLKLWSETIELADYYSSCSIQSGFLGIPTWASLDWNAEITRTSKKYDSSISISYLGPARDEKRFDDFAQFIKTLSQCSSEINLSQIKEVFISVVEPKRGYSSQVRQAIKEIKSIDNLPINLSSECLTREEYIKRLHQASLVWLAYDEKAYADGRGSGILVDCLASGSCFIARSNTTPTHYLRGNGILVNDPESGIHSLQQFLQNLDQAAKGAAKMQQHYIANYASDVMTRKILAKQITDTSNFRLGNAHLVTIKSSNGKIGENCSIETASSPPPLRRLESTTYTLALATATINGQESISRTISSVLQLSHSIPIRYHVEISSRTSDETRELVKMWDSIFRESRHNVKFTYAVSDDSSLYTGLLNAFSHLIADCSDETWVGWINDDDQLSPDVARILLSLNDTYPEISCLSGVPAIRGSQNTNILDFRLCNKLLSLGLYDGLHLPFLQQEGTFLKATIWKENLSAIRHSWQSLKYAGDYYLWSFLSRQHRFYLYSKPLGIFNMADGAAQLSQSCKNLYLSEINSILPLESRKSSFEAALESQNAHLQYTVLCPEWSVLRAKVIELPFELLGHKKFRSKSYRDLG